VDPVPDTILCYNGGAFLTTEGSDSLEDLQNLEAAGTKIITCGTCLNFYGLTDKVKVGTVGNMYDIADILSHAGRIVRP
jgi:peroxiredoxin family protein